jgi:signal transduction histidine kinase
VKQRIARTIVGVTALVLVLLGVPFAIVVQRFYESRATIELQSLAAAVVVEMQLPLDVDQIARAAEEPDEPHDFTIYDAAGDLLFGDGPARLGTGSADELVVVTPITERTNESVAGFVRVSRPRSDIDAQTWRAWAVMALAAAGGIAVAMLVARREAARLAAPITELARRAERLGTGDFDVEVAPVTGIAEIDTLADSLTVSSRRLAELLAREREFSANASHQLRTPLAGLKMSLDRRDLDAADAAVDRLSTTIEHLLAVSRGALPGPDELDLVPVVEEAVARWRPAFRGTARQLALRVADGLPLIRARAASVEQAIDILLDNSLQHGAGTTRVALRPARGGLVVVVDDDGDGIAPEEADLVFERHHGDRTGIGLDLARTLIRAEGGRLELTDPERAQFQITFAATA